MATFVMVHGAWGGGWAWRRTIAPLLEKNGHTVYTPTLTGLGERSHLATPATDLETHIQDICNVLFWEDLHDVVLAGHSYGGMVITGVADRMADRLQRLVYLDALLPENGQSVEDLTAPTPEDRAALQARIVDGWKIEPSPPDPNMSPAVRDWALPRRGYQPLQTFLQPFTVTGGLGQGLPRLYALCTNPVGPSFGRIAPKVRDHPQWQYVEFPTGHNLHYTMAPEVAALLEDLAAGKR